MSDNNFMFVNRYYFDIKLKIINEEINPEKILLEWCNYCFDNGFDVKANKIYKLLREIRG